MSRPRLRATALLLAVAALALAMTAAPDARADSKWAAWPKKAAPSDKTTASKAGSKKAAKPAPVAAPAKGAGGKPGKATRAAAVPAKAPARGKLAAKPKEPPPPPGKLAVFVFDGEATSAMRSQVVRVLRANGFKVVTSLRPVDSAEQYREMAATLGLAAYVDGDVEDEGEACSATITVRSGTTGHRVASTTFSGERRKLAGDIGKTLWTRVGPTLQRARVDAAKPRKPEHSPLKIDAGSPL